MRMTTFALATLLALPVIAQTHDQHMHDQHMHGASDTASPYVDRTHLEIKALTNDAIDAYKKGTGMGMAIAAELNGYPGPRHVLDMADELRLTADQRARIQRIYDAMHAAAVPLGESIIEHERELDQAFAKGVADDATIAKLTSAIAAESGRLRSVHLQAHVATRAILNAAQIEQYGKLRGY